MDLATIVKDYSTLITAILGLVGIVLTYLLTRSHYTRTRNWELENRDFNRRATIHDMRIKEAREYVDIVHEILHKMGLIFAVILNPSGIVTLQEDVIGTEALAKEITDLMKVAGKQDIAISILCDDELESWHKQIISIIFSDAVYLPTLMTGILSGSYPNLLNADREKIEELRHSYAIGEKMIAIMKARLDELAQEIH